MTDQLALNFNPPRWALSPAELRSCLVTDFRWLAWWQLYERAHAAGVAVDTWEPCSCSACKPVAGRRALLGEDAA